MRRAFVILALAFSAGPGFSQKLDPAKWSLAVKPGSAPPGSKVVATLQAKLDPGWHLYSLSTPKGGPVPTTIKLSPNPAVEQLRIWQPKPKRAFDKNFNLDTETYETQASFLLEVDLKRDAPPGSAPLIAEVRYQVCNDRLCIPPVRRTATANLTVNPTANAAATSIPPSYTEFKPGENAATPQETADARGLGAFLLVAFGFGLAAIFTPCVFPMIPITMSFFLSKGSVTRRQSLFQAGIFCLGIVLLFTAMGLVATALLGPFGVVQIGSNPWVNGFIAAIFLAFGLSLLGAFEITIPSSVLTKLDQASQKRGTAGTLLMGLTFSLTSFACVGPFVGTLLAASVQGGGTRPLVGMLAFSTGLALPFFILALFPSYLQRMPKSGGWLARVKVVMGFIILAAMLKYVSSIDQVMQWNFLTRERFLAAWIVLFSMAGLYLLGFLRLEGIGKDDRMGIARLLTGVFFLIFAISLIPGMFGGKLGELDAYVPVASETSLAWMKNQFREALEKARREGKLVLVNFTGYACTNCHWMKANMFTRPEIAAVMKEFVLVELYTDGTDEASGVNQKLQESKFSTSAIPFYVIFTPDEKVIASFPGLTRNPQEYLAFLRKGEGLKAAPVVKGSDLSALQATSLDGAAFDTAALQGKVVVLNFWATWCVPCLKEIPSFNTMHQQLADKGVMVLGVSLDEEGASLVRKFLKDHPMKYKVALGSDKLAEQFGVSQLPTTVVFDRSGKTVKRFEGFTPPESLEAAVQVAL